MMDWLWFIVASSSSGLGYALGRRHASQRLADRLFARELRFRQPEPIDPAGMERVSAELTEKLIGEWDRRPQPIPSALTKEALDRVSDYSRAFRDQYPAPLLSIQAQLRAAGKCAKPVSTNLGQVLCLADADHDGDCA